MIDTSKLKMPEHPDLWHASLEEVEGGKSWTLRGADHWVVMESDGCLRIDWDEQDAQVAAAAPLLLEEVKRLRERLRILNGMNNALWNTVENYDICLDDFTMIDLLNPPKGYEFCEDEERWVKKNEMD